MNNNICKYPDVARIFLFGFMTNERFFFNMTINEFIYYDKIKNKKGYDCFSDISYE